MKRDGHSHSHFCMHASGEELEAYIVRAIELGFEMYTVSEHLPYPDEFLKGLAYPQEIIDSLKIKDDDYDAYIREAQRLKTKYRDRIQLLVGAEVDFLDEYMPYTRYMLAEYGPYLDDSLLSVHFIRGRRGWRAVDQDLEDFEDGLLKYYGSYEKVQLAYYRTIKDALKAELGPHKPKRIGHLSLCNKFQCRFNPDGHVDAEVQKAVLNILGHLKKHGCSLDVNAAGLFKEYCREIYPAPWIIAAAKEKGIPMVYGSDSHSPAHVGRGYEIFEQLMKPGIFSEQGLYK